MKNKRLILLVAAAVALATGCVKTRYAQTGPVQEPRGEVCDFRIFTTAPPAGYEELGVLDMVYQTDDLTNFKELITKDVCMAGGDGVIAFANGIGVYVKGTVIKQAPAGAAPSGG